MTEKRSPPAAFDVEALLLLMNDGLLFEPMGVEELLHSAHRSHDRLALTLGRVGDSRSLPLLEGLLVDHRPEVRRNAAFALGLLGDAGAGPALAAAALDSDEETGRLAIEALARLGEPAAFVSGVLATVAESDLRRRLAPALFRLTGDEIDAWLDLYPPLDAYERRWVVYAVARGGGERGVPLLRRSLGDPDPWVRGWSARGLARLGEASDLERLRALLEDAEAGPLVQALRAGGRLVAEGRVAADRRWLPSIRSLLVDRRPGVWASALEIAGYWLLDEGLEGDLRRMVEDGPGRKGELALRALVTGRSESSEELTLYAALSPDSAMRTSAAWSAGELGILDVLDLLASDSASRVRLSALAARLAVDEKDRSRIARAALADSDPAIRAAALEWLAQAPIAPVEEILAAMRGPQARRLPELAINGVRAVAARSAEPLERGACIGALEELARAADFLVRRESANALEHLGRPRPPIGWMDTGIALQGYREVAARTARARLVLMETSRGVMTLEIACQQAPLTCASFMQLVNQGFYDGLSFHRVVPDFVVQSGDPRGDGWGGPGYSLRDEATRMRFERGVLGMARGGRHTAGSQFFITLSRQPHLDGDFTAFGRVIDGAATLDEIIQGDRIMSMREVTTVLPAVDSGR
ncbi:MAG: peptidylprolyl isomerase [Acidobacteriota bacterium]|nr:peptidylprolyl isomerase [Acidobacteriota bacterium]